MNEYQQNNYPSMYTILVNDSDGEMETENVENWIKYLKESGGKMLEKSCDGLESKVESDKQEVLNAKESA